MSARSSGWLWTIVVAGSVVAAVPAQETQATLERIGVTRGICVLVGDTGALPAALARDSELTVFVQLAAPADAEKMRRQLDEAGLLGRRVYVQQGDYRRLHLADDLADAVIVAAGIDVPTGEVLRVLHPNGKGLLAGKTLTKPFRAGSDDWSHPYHGPDNNPQSADKEMRRPFMTHYMVEPWYCPLPMQSVIAGGRVFKVFGDRSSARPQEPLINKLVAMNAFNGTILWQRDLSPGFMIHRNTLIVSDDTLYLGDDKACHFIDAATGKVRDAFVVPPELSDGPTWKWMALDQGVLYALVGEKEGSDQPLRGDRIRGAGWPWWKIQDYWFGHGKNLLAIDPKTKKVLWHHREPETIDARGLAMRNGKIYACSEGKYLVCLDAGTGKVLWRNSDRMLLDAVGSSKGAQHWLLGFASTAYMKVSDDAIYFAGPNRPLLVAASARDGSLLWTKDCSVKSGAFPTEGGNVQLVIRPEGLYALGQGSVNWVDSSYKLEPLTGKVLATFNSRDRCTRATGCADSIFTRGGKGGSTAVFDVDTLQPRMGTISPMRPACQDGVISAHGYLFWGPWMCRCDMTQLGVISLGSAGSFDYTGAAKTGDRLETAPDPADMMHVNLIDGDWPTYRRDNARSVMTSHMTPAKVALEWTFQPPAKIMPAAPIAAAGLVYLASHDGTVRAIESTTGKVAWTAYTGGPIRYPPALAGDRLYVGSGDGHVYCFGAAQGKLQWRFRAAPIERSIPLYGTLSSTWPIGSGVLVSDGMVFGAAGITNLDGSHVFALDARTGTIRWQQHHTTYEEQDVPMGGVSVQGPLLLHNSTIHMAAGNTPPIATYAAADGKFAGSPNGRGKDLHVRGGQVFGSGLPLYWRPEDDQLLSTMELECPAGVLRVGVPQNDPNAVSQLQLLPPHERGAKVPAKWSNPVFQEVSAVAFTRDALLVTGVNRAPKSVEITETAVCAIDLVTGMVRWKHTLPGVPTAWGLALDRDGRILVTLMDGRLLAFR